MSPPTLSTCAVTGSGRMAFPATVTRFLDAFAVRRYDFATGDLSRVLLVKAHV